MKTFRRIAQCESGSFSVEFVLWLPIYIVLLIMVIESSLFFTSKNRMEQVTQNAVRQIAVGDLDADDLDTFIQSQGFAASAYTASSTVTLSTVSVSMSVPINQAANTGVFSILGLTGLSTTVSQRKEI